MELAWTSTHETLPFSRIFTRYVRIESSTKISVEQTHTVHIFALQPRNLVGYGRSGHSHESLWLQTMPPIKQERKLLARRVLTAGFCLRKTLTLEHGTSTRSSQNTMGRQPTQVDIRFGRSRIYSRDFLPHTPVTKTSLIFLQLQKNCNTLIH